MTLALCKKRLIDEYFRILTHRSLVRCTTISTNPITIYVIAHAYARAHAQYQKTISFFIYFCHTDSYSPIIVRVTPAIVYYGPQETQDGQMMSKVTKEIHLII